ncbi:MAG: hypothetical protein WCP39_08085 [Chlamydiota bacterium]
MGQKKRLKLCQYCDGQLDLDVIVCPYCGNEVVEKKKEDLPVGSPFSSQKTESSLYPPPYRSTREESEEIFMKQEPMQKEEVLEAPEEKGAFLSTMLFSLGINLVLVGFFILLFSRHGELLLRWDSRFWFVYVLLALPLIFFGFRGLTKSEK